MGMIKTEKEIRLLEKSAAISNSCIPLIEKSLKEKNITERELARRIRKKINSQGATLSFQTLVGSGRRSSMIHTKPNVTDRTIGGVGYIDYGASYRGCKTDVTVPFTKGKINKGERRIVNLVLRAYQIGVESVKAGEYCWKPYENVDRFLKKNGFRMKHFIGHGVGRRIHELPMIGKPRKKLRGKKRKRWEKLKKMVFQPGMAFTIEPAIYTKHFGCRIENSFIMLKSKRIKSLTKSRLIEV